MEVDVDRGVLGGGATRPRGGEDRLVCRAANHGSDIRVSSARRGGPRAAAAQRAAAARAPERGPGGPRAAPRRAAPRRAASQPPTAARTNGRCRRTLRRIGRNPTRS